MKRARFFHLWAVLALLVSIASGPLVIGQCAIRPIKPIPPIGCKDVTPECVSDSNGKSHWNWICVPNNAETDTSQGPVWKPHAPEPATPSAPNVSTGQTTSHDPATKPFQEPAAAIGVLIAEMDAGERHATEQLRTIAEAIKNCPPLEMPHGIPDYDQMVAEGFVDTNGPPQNVVWNVERQPSIRGRYEGTIEFSEPSTLRPPLDTDYCNKRGIDKSKCRHIWSLGWQVYRRQADHPHEFRYEFDVTSHGLELSRVFKKTEQTDDEPWVSGSQDSDGCASKAIKSTLNDPNNAAQTSAAPITFASQGGKQDNGQAQVQGSAGIHQAPSEISAVGIGMTREVVLSGLSGHYKLTKEDLGAGPESKQEVWSVEEKASSAPADFWEIFFEDGKVGSVITHLSPTLHGDAVALAQQLFAEVYTRADADPGQVAKFLGTRRITLEVELGQMTTGKSNEESMRFHFQNGSVFEIRIEAPVALPPSVSMSNFKTE